MKQDIIKGMKLGAKPFLVINALIGILPVFYLLSSIHWLLAFHVLATYLNFFLMGLLIIKYAENKGLL